MGEELIIRGYEAADAAAVAGLFNRLAEHAGARAWAAPEQVHAYLAGWVRDPERDSRLLFTPDRTLEIRQAVAPATDWDVHVDADLDRDGNAVGVYQRAGFAVESRAATYTARLGPCASLPVCGLSTAARSGGPGSR